MMKFLFFTIFTTIFVNLPSIMTNTTLLDTNDFFSKSNQENVESLEKYIKFLKNENLFTNDVLNILKITSLEKNLNEIKNKFDKLAVKKLILNLYNFFEIL